MSNMIINMVIQEIDEPSPYFGGIHRQTWIKIMGGLGLLTQIAVAIITAPYGLMIAAIIIPIVYSPMIASKKLEPTFFIPFFGLMVSNCFRFKKGY